MPNPRGRSGHECPAPSCRRWVPRAKLACAADWARVPVPLQRELYASYRQEPLSDRHLAAMRAVIEWLEGAA